MRQRPGAGNALGLIKLVMPNTYSVYLHSTPEQHLFGEAQRAYSHGCIRVVDPVALAVHVLHGTALAKEDGQVMFFKDIYGHDRRLERLLRTAAR